jgi:hypothetical protein
MISGSDLRALPPDMNDEEPTGKADLRITMVRSEDRLSVGLRVSQDDGSGIVAASVGIVGAAVVGVGGPTATLWAAHAAGFAPGWACCMAAAQLLLAKSMVVRSYRWWRKKK